MSLPIHANKTITHIQIAELVGSRDNDVKKSIKTLAAKGVISFTASPLTRANARDGELLELSERDSYIAIAQLCPEFTAKLVDFWQAAIKEPVLTPALPQTLPEALRLAADLAEDKIKLEADKERLNRVCNDLASQLATGITPPKFAKLLNGVNSQQIQGYLIERKYIKHCTGKDCTGMEILHKSRATSRFTQHWDNTGGKNRGKVHVTEHGANWLYRLYQGGKLPMLKSWNKSLTTDLFLSEKLQLALVHSAKEA